MVSAYVMVIFYSYPVDLIFIALFLVFFAGVSGLVFHYKVWKSIPDNHSGITPAKAVGFLFIPVFNIYWLFKSVYGFAKELNYQIDRYGAPIKKLPSPLYLVQCILILILSILSRLGTGSAMFVALLVMFIIYINFIIIINMSANAVNSLNAIKEPEKAVDGE